MDNKLLNLVKETVSKKNIDCESIKVYDKKYDDGSGKTIIVVNDKYEFHMVGGFSNFKSCYSRRGSLVLLNKDDKKGIKDGFFTSDHTEDGRGIFVCRFTLVEEI